MTFVIGLTGSIGMGKSTTAEIFTSEGCELWDADAAVHRLYSKNGLAVPLMMGLFPKAVIDGAVCRAALKEIIRENPKTILEIERIVHPLVEQDRAAFLQNAKSDILVLDIPLLFETGADADMDATVCVSIDPIEQKRRVLARGQMTEADFKTILAKQMPDAEKRAKSDYVIITDTIENVRDKVRAIIKDVRDTPNA